MSKFSLKIMLAIIVCSVVTTTILLGVSIQKSTSILLAETEKTLTLSSEKYANEFSAAFQNTEGIVDALTSNINVTFNYEEHKKNPEYIDEYIKYLDKVIKETIQDSDQVHGLYFTFSPDLTEIQKEVWYAYDVNSRVYKVAANFGPGYREFTLPPKIDMKYYFDPIQTRNGEWTGPYVDSDVSLSMISYSKAVFAGDVIIGVTGADILTRDTIDIVETMKIYDQSTAMLLDPKLMPIVTSGEYKKTAFYNNQNNDTFTNKLTKNNTDISRLNSEGKEYIVAHSHLSNGWILAIEQPISAVYSSIKTLTFVLIAITLAAIIVAIVFATIIAKKVSMPISNAAQRLKQLGMGDYSQPVPDSLKKRNDDIGEMAQAISAIQEAIAIEAKQNREKDALLIYQSKQAKIGDMVGNISHQWKQPLNNINLVLLNLYDSYVYNEMTDMAFKEAVDKIMKIVHSMWETIEDFTHFMKPSKDPMVFNVLKTVDTALELMEDSIKANGIAVDVKIEEDMTLLGYSNEFSQVLLNIMNNALDAIVEARLDVREIRVKGFSLEDKIILEVANNGPQIPMDILPDIFEPYITTKEEHNGTGIGLYISRIIIEQRMRGKIDMENLPNGVLCRITLKKSQEC